MAHILLFINNFISIKANILDILKLISRTDELFKKDISHYEKQLSDAVSSSSFLVIGGGGFFGQAGTKKKF